MIPAPLRTCCGALFLALACGCTTIGEDEIEPGEALASGYAFGTGGARRGVGWREWRGPLRDGVVEGIQLPDQLPEGEWPELWRVHVGVGLSGLVTDEGRLFCHSRVGRQEIVSAHGVETGRLIWSRENPIKSWSQPLPAWKITGGPLATPSVAGGRLYTVGVHGLVQCLDARDGRVIFSVSSEIPDGERSRHMYGHAASPLVREGRLYVSFSTGEEGHFLALDARTGEVLWKALEDTLNYTSPVYTTIHGEEQIVVRTWERLVGLQPDTGAILWSHDAVAFGLRRDCATPLVVGDVIYQTSSFHGTIAVWVSREGETWKAERLFRTGALGGCTASPVFHDDHVYGLHRRGYFTCMDARSGRRVWVARDFDDHLSIISFGDRILALDNEGKLALIELSPEEYRPVASWRVGEYTWAHPAIDEKRLYLRDREDLVCLPIGAASGG